MDRTVFMGLREACGSQVNVPNWVGESYLQNPAEMLDLKPQEWPGVVGGYDPDVEKLGAGLYKQYVEKYDLPLLPCVGAAFLGNRTPAEVAERAKHDIKTGDRNGGFALLLCKPGTMTPPENVKAVVEAVRRNGVYDA